MLVHLPRYGLVKYLRLLSHQCDSLLVVSDYAKTKYLMIPVMLSYDNSQSPFTTLFNWLCNALVVLVEKFFTAFVM